MPFDLETRLADAWPPDRWQDLTVLVAVSGGSDSVALLRAMMAIKKGGAGKLLAAHFNHRLRAVESDADQAFVEQLCRWLGVPCHVGHAVVGEKKGDRHRGDNVSCGAAANCATEPVPLFPGGGEGLEAAARDARYDFLRQTAARIGARYVVTGHTADDQVETILHRILRGTGIAGLSGMARSRPLGEATPLIRPLLGFRRAELVSYLDHLGQPYRTDSSNADTRFTRNRLRHELLPLLAERFNPAIDEALLRLAALAGEVQAIVDRLVRDLADRSIIEKGNATGIDSPAVAGAPPYLVRELLMDVWQLRGWPLQSMGYAEWDELANMLLHGRPNKKTFPGGVTAERVGQRLWLCREEEVKGEA